MKLYLRHYPPCRLSTFCLIKECLVPCGPALRHRLRTTQPFESPDFLGVNANMSRLSFFQYDRSISGKEVNVNMFKRRGIIDLQAMPNL